MHPLIEATELMALQRAGTPLVLLDCSFELTDTGAGERAYVAGHLPGAHYAHLDRDLSGPLRGADGVFRGRHPLPARDPFAG
jgi:thiosulfate/3-mercaptopyruvate sulfurtransferase